MCTKTSHYCSKSPFEFVIFHPDRNHWRKWNGNLDHPTRYRGHFLSSNDFVRENSVLIVLLKFLSNIFFAICPGRTRKFPFDECALQIMEIPLGRLHEKWGGKIPRKVFVNHFLCFGLFFRFSRLFWYSSVNTRHGET